MTYIEIAGVRYPAAVLGRMRDPDWNDRKSKAITLEMTHETAKALFVDGLAWSIVCVGESGAETVYDNGEYHMAGPITDHRDGTVTVKMGAVTAEEALRALLAKYGEA